MPMKGRVIRVTFLGTGGAVPSVERYASSILVTDWNGAKIMLDAGEGAQLRLQQAGYSTPQIDLIAITHAHGDHVNGLAGLLQSMAVNKRKRALNLVAPRSVIEFTLETLEATEARLGFPVETTVIEEAEAPMRIYSKGGDTLEIGWFKTCHTLDSYGFTLKWSLRPRIRVDTSHQPPRHVWGRIGELLGGPTGVTIAYTGDTAPCKTVLEAVRGVDVLVHDSTFDPSMGEEAIEKLHSTSLHAALIAREAGARVLVLTHISARYRGYEARVLLEEARKVFPNTVLAYDLMRLEVRAPIREVPLSRILASL
ncbi:MAG: ribonuclease Z [Desulfurococcales archaeon]|nr:ribonuclease Z [Desulfurococcales archaeon]